MKCKHTTDTLLTFVTIVSVKAIYLPPQAMELLSRELVYTGLTRAKRELFVVGEWSVWLDGVTRQVDRYSDLNNKLKSSFPNTNDLTCVVYQTQKNNREAYL